MFLFKMGTTHAYHGQTGPDRSFPRVSGVFNRPAAGRREKRKVRACLTQGLNEERSGTDQKSGSDRSGSHAWRGNPGDGIAAVEYEWASHWEFRELPALWKQDSTVRRHAIPPRAAATTTLDREKCGSPFRNPGSAGSRAR